MVYHLNPTMVHPTVAPHRRWGWNQVGWGLKITHRSTNFQPKKKNLVDFFRWRWFLPKGGKQIFSAFVSQFFVPINKWRGFLSTFWECLWSYGCPKAPQLSSFQPFVGDFGQAWKVTRKLTCHPEKQSAWRTTGLFFEIYNGGHVCFRGV